MHKLCVGRCRPKRPQTATCLNLDESSPNAGDSCPSPGNATLTRQLSRGSVENRYLQAGATLEWLLANPELRDPQEIAASSGSTMVGRLGREGGPRQRNGRGSGRVRTAGAKHAPRPSNQHSNELRR
jgi:hypothetical protein